MIATIGTVLVWMLIGILCIGVALCAFVGLMFLTGYKR